MLNLIKLSKIFVFMLRKWFYFFLIFSIVLKIISLSGCVSHARFKVLYPAEIALPTDIKSVVIINRSRFNPNMDSIQQIEQQMIPHLIQTLNDNFKLSPRIVPVIAHEEDIKTSRHIPPPMLWEKAAFFCQKYDAEALISIDDIHFEHSIESGKTADHEYFAHLKIEFETFVRLYYPEKQIILDQAPISSSKNWKRTGSSQEEAFHKLISINQALRNVTVASGEKYVKRISPHWQYQKRDYFKKGKDNGYFHEALRHAEIGNWEEAIMLWEKASTSDNPKIASRATYNIALGHEILGNIEEARKWASLSFTKYNLKRGMKYTRVLESRINDQRKLKSQLN